MYTSNFTQISGRASYSPSFAVRVHPGPGESRATDGAHNYDLHSGILASYGHTIDDALFDSTVGSSYLDVYRLLLDRAVTSGLRLPPLLVTGNAVPDLRLDQSPSVRMLGEFEGPIASFAVMEETSLAAILALHAAIVAARSQRHEAFAVVLADRSAASFSRCHPDDVGGQPVDERGVLLGFDRASSATEDGGLEVHWRSGLVSREDVVAAAEDLARLTEEQVVIPASLAAQWPGHAGRAQVAPAGRPATGLVDAALDLPGGSEPLLIGFDARRGQLGAMSLRVPEVSL